MTLRRDRREPSYCFDCNCQIPEDKLRYAIRGCHFAPLCTECYIASGDDNHRSYLEHRRRMGWEVKGDER